MGIFDIFKQIESQQQTIAGPPEWIIAGLGNIGAQYHNTRHNAGFLMLDAFAKQQHTEFGKHRFRSHTAAVQYKETSLLLMKPETYMNLSGQAITEAMRFYHIPPERTLIIYDDITLPVGGVRIRQKGSDGGHNGMKNIIYLSGADTFPRVRVGIGQKPHPDYPLADWVLSAFSPTELETLNSTAESVCAAIPLILEGRIDLAMSRYNAGKPKSGTSDARK